MRLVKFLFLAFLDFVSAIFIGAVVGCLIGIGFSSIRSSNVFVQWRQLDSPVKFAQIVDATPDAIMASSTEGKLYQWNAWDCQFNKKCNWVEAGETQLYRDEETTTARKNVCQQEGYDSPRYPPGNVMECVFTRRIAAEYSRTAYYAILDDETIWYWFVEGDLNREILTFFLSILFGGIVGIVLGIVVIYRKEKNFKYG